VNENFPSPGKPRLRRLSAEEIELWLNVTRGVARRPGSGSPQLPQPRKDAELPASEAGNNLPKGASAEPPPSPVERKAPLPLAPLERRLRQKLARGRVAPDAAIDLHGMRRQEASAALWEFLARAQIEGARLVLVVTGKGERAAYGEATPGILRKSVPSWLRGAEYRAIVLGFEVASRPHGGAGALYVRLRRRDRAGRGKPSP
jgi:DNA-nicking Smr family endonuclease